MWCICTIGYYSALKKAILSCHSIDEPWRYDTWRTTVAWFHLRAVSKVVKFMEAENRVVVSRDWEKREMGSCCATGSFSHIRWKVLEICCTTFCLWVSNIVHLLIKFVNRVDFTLHVFTIIFLKRAYGSFSFPSAKVNMQHEWEISLFWASSHSLT